MLTTELLTARGLHIDIGQAASRPEVEQDAMRWAFGLESPQFRLFTTGMKARLPSGPSATLGERTRRFFEDLLVRAEHETQPSPRLLVGALPFDRKADDFLFLPEAASNNPWSLDATAQAAPGGLRAVAEPSREAYAAAVNAALKAIRASQGSAPPIDKVVLSRSLKVEADAPIDPFALWMSLKADPAALRFLTPVGPGADSAMRRLVGATPELLVSKQGARVVSHPLAGSAPRSADIAVDEASAKGLLASDKDRREHALVVEMILDALAPWCVELSAPPGPSLMSTRTLWHLGTRIEGRLRHPEATSSAELAAVLHPTPAVGGSPHDEAVDLIHALEGYDRGFYAGAVGWTNAEGDGAWHVSLRCAEVNGRTGRLYAGAGIVEGSDAHAEVEETSTKLLAVLRALGVDETGAPLAAAHASTAA